MNEPEKLFNFLNELKDNNNRDWFAANKATYENCKKNFEAFINELLAGIASFDSSVSNLTAKECVFRIYKDIRFSHDKTPYKTNFGAYMSRGGRKGGYCGYYFHVEPSESFLAGGIYQPSPEVAKAIRDEIYHNPDEYLSLINNKVFKKYFDELWGEKMKVAPRGYDKTFEHIEQLKFKSWVPFHQMKDAQLSQPDLMKYALDVYKATYPFNDFINKIIDG